MSREIKASRLKKKDVLLYNGKEIPLTKVDVRPGNVHIYGKYFEKIFYPQQIVRIVD